jgi:hypothetical protein
MKVYLFARRESLDGDGVSDTLIKSQYFLETLE